MFHGITYRVTAVLERANTLDIWCTKVLIFLCKYNCTGSLRRQAQWLNEYPNHKVVDLRERQSRECKVAATGAELFCGSRTGKNKLKPTDYDLDWMIPAPAQGAMVVVAMANDEFCRQTSAKRTTILIPKFAHTSKDFKNTRRRLYGTIGALAVFVEDDIVFKGVLFIRWKKKIEVEKPFNARMEKIRFYYAQEILDNGGWN
jgi:hydroxymethylbilane synthase